MNITSGSNSNLHASQTPTNFAPYKKNSTPALNKTSLLDSNRCQQNRMLSPQTGLSQKIRSNSLHCVTRSAQPLLENYPMIEITDSSNNNWLQRIKKPLKLDKDKYEVNSHPLYILKLK